MEQDLDAEAEAVDKRLTDLVGVHPVVLVHQPADLQRLLRGKVGEQSALPLEKCVPLGCVLRGLRIERLVWVEAAVEEVFENRLHNKNSHTNYFGDIIAQFIVKINGFWYKILYSVTIRLKSDSLELISISILTS